MELRMTQILTIEITGEKTIAEIKPVDVKKAKIRFVNFTDFNMRAYFEDETHIIIEGGSGEVEIEVYDI